MGAHPRRAAVLCGGHLEPQVKKKFHSILEREDLLLCLWQKISAPPPIEKQKAMLVGPKREFEDEPPSAKVPRAEEDTEDADFLYDVLIANRADLSSAQRAKRAAIIADYTTLKWMDPGLDQFVGRELWRVFRFYDRRHWVTTPILFELFLLVHRNWALLADRPDDQAKVVAHMKTLIFDSYTCIELFTKGSASLPGDELLMEVALHELGFGFSSHGPSMTFYLDTQYPNLFKAALQLADHRISAYYKRFTYMADRGSFLAMRNPLPFDPSQMFVLIRDAMQEHGMLLERGTDEYEMIIYDEGILEDMSTDELLMSSFTFDVHHLAELVIELARAGLFEKMCILLSSDRLTGETGTSAFAIRRGGMMPKYIHEKVFLNKGMPVSGYPYLLQYYDRIPSGLARGMYMEWVRSWIPLPADARVAAIDGFIVPAFWGEKWGTGAMLVVDWFLREMVTKRQLDTRESYRVVEALLERVPNITRYITRGTSPVVISTVLMWQFLIADDDDDDEDVHLEISTARAEHRMFNALLSTWHNVDLETVTIFGKFINDGVDAFVAQYALRPALCIAAARMAHSLMTALYASEDVQNAAERSDARDEFLIEQFYNLETTHPRHILRRYGREEEEEPRYAAPAAAQIGDPLVCPAPKSTRCEKESMTLVAQEVYRLAVLGPKCWAITCPTLHGKIGIMEKTIVDGCMQLCAATAHVHLRCQLSAQLIKLFTAFCANALLVWTCNTKKIVAQNEKAEHRIAHSVREIEHVVAGYHLDEQVHSALVDLQTRWYDYMNCVLAAHSKKKEPCLCSDALYSGSEFVSSADRLTVLLCQILNS
jgi:hypothetical protein